MTSTTISMLLLLQEDFEIDKLHGHVDGMDVKY
jgi:hypothetical protein